MRLDRLTGVVAIVLFAAYYGPILLKLKEISLGLVLVGGIALVVADYVDSLRD